MGSNTGTITNSYANGGVSGEFDTVGGLVGDNLWDIIDCYATGSVSQNGWIVGGLVGYNRGKIINCYSVTRAEVGGGPGNWAPVGGLLGIDEGTVTSSFWDIETSGLSTSAGGTGKSRAEMNDPNTFMDAGWDFVGESDGPSDIWAEPVGGGYPILWWQLSPLPELPSFSEGTGSTDDPYLLSTAGELNRIGHNQRLMQAHFKLTNDIDFTDIQFFTIGSLGYPFTGVFDGNGKRISNFSYTSPDGIFIGLFGFVGGWKDAVIKDLGLIDPNVDTVTGNYVGSLVGYLQSGTITGCYVDEGKISGGMNVGGLVGSNAWGTINNCFSTGYVVSGEFTIGGLLGANAGTITSCSSSGDVSGGAYVGGLVGRNWAVVSECSANGRVSGEGRVGGLVGWNENGEITFCHASASVSWGEQLGGLVGRNYGMINNCYATGMVWGTRNLIGGLVGDNLYGGVANCYSIGNVMGWTDLGGLLGRNGGELTDSFWDIETSGLSNSDGGTGRTTSEMQMESTFTNAGWDFINETANGSDDIWWILEGQDYPRLWWEIVEE